MKYRTVDEDRLDAICNNHYGHLRGSVEAVLEANPGLSEQPAVLSAGVWIELPELPEPETVTPVKTVSLWS